MMLRLIGQFFRFHVVQWGDLLAKCSQGLLKPWFRWLEVWAAGLLSFMGSIPSGLIPSMEVSWYEKGQVGRLVWEVTCHSYSILLVKIRQGFISRGEETDPTFDGTYGNPTVKVRGHMEM